MNIKKQTIQGVFWSAIQNWGSQAGSFIVFLILARLLTPEAFGLVALANVLINFMQIFLDQGLAAVLIQKKDIESKHINTVFWTQCLIGFFLTIISFTTADLIAINFNQPQLSLILKWFSILFIISSFSLTQIALLQRKFAFKYLATRALLGILMAGIVGITMAFLGYGVWSLVGQQLTYEIVGVIVLWKASDWRPKLEFSWQDLGELFDFSVNLLGYKLTNFFNQRIDILLIGYFLGEVALGYYAIAHRILQVMTQLLIGTLNQVALPAFSRLQDNSQQFVDGFYRANQFTSLIAFPVFFATIILSPELVITLFGEQWKNTIPIMQILSFAGILRVMSFLQASVFTAMGQPLLQFKIGLVSAIFNLIACLIAVHWGIVAVAVAYVISDYLVFPIGQWFLSQLISLSWKTYFAQFLAPITCNLIMILTIFLTQKVLIPDLNPPLRLVICSIIGIIIYSLTLVGIFPQLFKQICDLVTLLQPTVKIKR